MGSVDPSDPSDPSDRYDPQADAPGTAEATHSGAPEDAPVDAPEDAHGDYYEGADADVDAGGDDPAYGVVGRDVPTAPATGDEIVDAAMIELAAAEARSLAERIDAGERAHRVLQGRLSDLGGA
jgi:hypothetical protein